MNGAQEFTNDEELALYALVVDPAELFSGAPQHMRGLLRPPHFLRHVGRHARLRYAAKPALPVFPETNQEYAESYDAEEFPLAAVFQCRAEMRELPDDGSAVAHLN